MASTTTKCAKKESAPKRSGYLTKEEMAFFEREGFVVVRNVLSDDDFKGFETEVSELIEKLANDLQKKGLLKEKYEKAPFNRRLALIVEACSDDTIEHVIKPFCSSLDTMNARLRSFFQFMFNKNLLNAVSSVVGEEITVSPIQHFRPFLPAKRTVKEDRQQIRAGAATLAPWHQDQGVTLEEADRSEILTCWIPLTDVHKEDSKPTEHPYPLKIMPRVHGEGLLRHVKGEYGTTIDPAVLPKISTVDANMRRGDVLFLNRYTPHRSQRNLSKFIRWSLDLRFNETGKPTGRPFWPSLVVRSRDDPSRVQASYSDWCSRWIRDLASSKGKRWHRVVGDVGGSIAGKRLHETPHVPKRV